MTRGRKKSFYADVIDLVIASDPPEIRAEQTDAGWELGVYELPEALVQEYATARAAYMRARDALIKKMKAQEKNQKPRKEWLEPKRKRNTKSVAGLHHGSFII